MARDEQIRVDLTAKDNASKTIAGVATAAEKLEDLSPEIEIRADADQAERTIDELGDDARRLSAVDAEIVLRAKVDAAKGDLRALQAELDQTGERAEDTARKLDRVDGPGTGGGLNTRGNAIADLTGPLGEASGAASDFAGVFDGLGDIAEDVAGKLGATPAAVAGLSTAIGGLGIAVAAGAAIWSAWSGKQKQAQEEARKTRDAAIRLNDALRAGNAEQFADQLVEQYADVFDAAKRAGVSVGEVTEFIIGQAREIPTLNAAQQAAVDALYERTAATGEQTTADREAHNAITSLRQAIYDAQAAYAAGDLTASQYQRTVDDVTAAVRDTNRATGAMTDELGAATRAVDTTKSALDALQGALDVETAMARFTETFNVAMWNASDQTDDTAVDILGLKQAILDVATYAGLTPIEVSTLLQRVEQGDIDGVRSAVESAYSRRPIQVATTLKVTGIYNPYGSVATPGLPPGFPSTGGLSAPAPSVVNVTQVLPRGYRERDTLAAAQGAARRSGGLYRRARR